MASIPPSQNAHVSMAHFVPNIDPVLVYKIFLAASSFLISSGAVIVRRSGNESHPLSPSPPPQATSSLQGEQSTITRPSNQANPSLHRSPSARENDHYSLRTPVNAASQASAPSLPKHQGCPTVGIDLSTRIVGHGNNIRIPPLEDNVLLVSALSHASKFGSEVTIRMGVSVYGSKNSVTYETSSMGEGKKRKTEERDEKVNIKRRG